MNFKRALDKSFMTGFTVGFYGAGGVGKTSIIGNLPPEETLYISIDDSSHPIREKNFYFAQLPKPSKENFKGFTTTLDEIYNEIRTNKNCQFKFIVIDSISELERYFQLQSVHKRNASRRIADAGDSVPVQKDYGDASILAYRYLIQFRDLKIPANNACGKAINTIFIANEMTDEVIKNDVNSVKKIVPFLTSKMAGKFRDAVDILGHLSAKDNGERFLQLEPSREVEAKNRFKFGSMKVPYNFDIVANIINPIRSEISAVFNQKK